MRNFKKRKYNIMDQKDIDIDLKDFLEKNYEGLSQLEIAREAGVDSSYVKELLEEIERDY